MSHAVTSAPRCRRALAAGAALVVLALGGCAGAADTQGTPEPTADVEPAADATPSAATPSPAAEVDLATFTPVDNATWLEIQNAPQSSAGQRVVVHAFVTRTYTATGGGTLQVAVTSAQPASEVEGTVAVLRGTPELLGGIEVGHVLRVHAEVAGAYTGRTGGGTRIPELTVHAAEDVGQYDLGADLALGEVSRVNGRMVVPVTVRNSSDAVLTYRVDLAATSPDGTLQSSARPQFASLAPGSSASLDVNLDPASADAELTWSIARALPDPVP